MTKATCQRTLLLGHDCLGFACLCSCGPGRRNIEGANQSAAGTKAKESTAPGTDRKSQARPGNKQAQQQLDQLKQSKTEPSQPQQPDAAQTQRQLDQLKNDQQLQRLQTDQQINRIQREPDSCAPATADRQFAAPAADRLSPGPNSPQSNSARSGPSAAAAEYEADKVESGFKPAYEYLSISPSTISLIFLSAIEQSPPENRRRPCDRRDKNARLSGVPCSSKRCISAIGNTLSLTPLTQSSGAHGCREFLDRAAKVSARIRSILAPWSGRRRRPKSRLTRTDTHRAAL